MSTAGNSRRGIFMGPNSDKIFSDVHQLNSELKSNVSETITIFVGRE
jgi:hypothetical protein